MKVEQAIKIAQMRADAHKKDFAVVKKDDEICVVTYVHAIQRNYEIIEIIRVDK